MVDEAGDKWLEEQKKQEAKDNKVAQEADKDVKGLDIGFNSYDAKADHGLVDLAKLQKRIIYEWEAKYTARKPRFFNRVKTGFQWNKYNTRHYDSEIPPPKMVMGYRFNIFYPDLVDKQKTPRYYLEWEDGQTEGGPQSGGGKEPDTVMIRFVAGPPYEDIAFKIVNLEWNANPRHGFRCVFDRGVLQLYFNFKRFGYRR